MRHHDLLHDGLACLFQVKEASEKLAEEMATKRDEHHLVMERREREHQESGNLVTMLQSDLNTASTDRSVDWLVDGFYGKSNRMGYFLPKSVINLTWYLAQYININVNICLRK